MSPPQPSPPPLSTQDWEDATVKGPSPRNLTNQVGRYTDTEAKGPPSDGITQPRSSQAMGQSGFVSFFKVFFLNVGAPGWLSRLSIRLRLRS